MAGEELCNLADVHLEQAASNDEADHARQDTARPKDGYRNSFVRKRPRRHRLVAEVATGPPKVVCRSPTLPP